MRWFLDLAYLLAVVVTLPLWLPRMIATGRIRTDWAGRFGRTPSIPVTPGQRRILVQAVSVGEVNAARLLVDRLARLPGSPEIVVATTTDTGFARACSLFTPKRPVVRYPFDVSVAVARFLSTVRPDAVVLVELEVWPNFIAACARRGTPVCVVNGRLSRRSARRYQWIAPIIRGTFRRLAFAAAQTDEYAARLHRLGVSQDRLHVTGTMKWDTAQIADHVQGAAELAQAMGIDRTRPLVVAGSTAPGEHELLVQSIPPGVQLLCAPRKPEWFDDAAAAMPGCARRSRGGCGSASGRFLLDTIGELRLAYALADLVVVGRSFGSLHGSDMIEPIALGKATIVGPAVTDFQDIVAALMDGGGLAQTSGEQLPQVIRELLADPDQRRRLADAGRAVIRSRQGATERHAQLIAELLDDG